MNKRLFILLILFTIALCNESYSQYSWWKDKKYKSKEKQLKFDNCKFTFINISDGFMYENVSYITPYFQDENYINLKNEDKGYYNRDQAKYILENFFTMYPSNSFKWKSSYSSESYAFATGKYIYKKDGYLGKFNISIFLKYINELWLIDQIVVN